MKGFLTAVCLLTYFLGFGQLLTWTPDFITESSSNIDITVDATRGNLGLKDYSSTSDVYIHTGVITNLSNYSYRLEIRKVQFVQYPDCGSCTTYLGNNKWKFTISGNLRTFYNISSPTEKILKITVLFRSGNGNIVQRNADGSDMYIPVYESGIAVRIIEPFKQPCSEPIQKTIGESITVTATANQSSAMKIFFNGVQVAAQNGVSIGLEQALWFQPAGT